jgi:hypothetical protein
MDIGGAVSLGMLQPQRRVRRTHFSRAPHPDWQCMTTSPAPYFSYLLRLWLAGDGDPPQWRASLENPRTGEQRGFADLQSLHAFLREQTENRVPPKKPKGL